MALTIVGLTACGGSNNSTKKNENSCKTCESIIDGVTSESEICKNEDGTLTVMQNGVEEIVSDVTYDELIQITESFGGTCY